MKSQTVTKLNNLLNIGIPKSQQEDRCHHDIIEYVTPDHIACVVVIAGTGDDHKRYSGQHEVDDLRIRNLIQMCHKEKHSKYNRKLLIEMLSNMDSEYVKLYMGEETPILIEGKTEDNVVSGGIAPVIDGDEE